MVFKYFLPRFLVLLFIVNILPFVFTSAATAATLDPLLISASVFSWARSLLYFPFTSGRSPRLPVCQLFWIGFWTSWKAWILLCSAEESWFFCFGGQLPWLDSDSTPHPLRAELKHTVQFLGLSRPSLGVHTLTCGSGISSRLGFRLSQIIPVVRLSSVLRGSPSHFLSLSCTIAGFLCTARAGTCSVPCRVGVVWVLRCRVSPSSLGRASPISTSLPPPEATPSVAVRLTCLFRFYFGFSHVQ